MGLLLCICQDKSALDVRRRRRMKQNEPEWQKLNRDCVFLGVAIVVFSPCRSFRSA